MVRSGGVPSWLAFVSSPRSADPLRGISFISLVPHCYIFLLVQWAHHFPMRRRRVTQQLDYNCWTLPFMCSTAWRLLSNVTVAYVPYRPSYSFGIIQRLFFFQSASWLQDGQLPALCKGRASSFFFEIVECCCQRLFKSALISLNNIFGCCIIILIIICSSSHRHHQISLSWLQPLGVI